MALAIDPRTGAFFEDTSPAPQADIYITMSNAVGGKPMGDFADVAGLQADSPYTPADTVLLPGAGETPLTYDVPYVNASDVIAPDGYGESSAGTTRDLGGVGEWLTNAFKNFSPFLKDLTSGPATRQAGGAYGAPGPGQTGRYALPGAGNTNANIGGSNGVMWLVLLGIGFVFVMSFGRR